MLPNGITERAPDTEPPDDPSIESDPFVTAAPLTSPEQIPLELPPDPQQEFVDAAVREFEEERMVSIGAQRCNATHREIDLRVYAERVREVAVRITRAADALGADSEFGTEKVLGDTCKLLEDIQGYGLGDHWDRVLLIVRAGIQFVGTARTLHENLPEVTGVSADAMIAAFMGAARRSDLVNLGLARVGDDTPQPKAPKARETKVEPVSPSPRPAPSAPGEKRSHHKRPISDRQTSLVEPKPNHDDVKAAREAQKLKAAEEKRVAKEKAAKEKAAARRLKELEREMAQLQRSQSQRK